MAFSVRIDEDTTIIAIEGVLAVNNRAPLSPISTGRGDSYSDAPAPR